MALLSLQRHVCGIHSSRPHLPTATTSTPAVLYCLLDSDSCAEGHAQHIRELIADRISRTAAYADTEEAVQVGQTRRAETSVIRYHPL